jgi:hypothetical protein
MAEPTPANVSPWYLRNVTQALALDETSGNVYIRTDANISVGNVTVGNVGITGFGNIDITGNTLPVTVESGNIDVTGNVTATISGVPTVSLDSQAVDAFGRLRVSNPVTLFDTRSRYYNHEQFATTATGSGSVTYDADSSTFDLTVIGSGDTVIRETEKTFVYQPGKSLLVFNTFCMNTPTTSLKQRVGYYGSDNGIFFEVDGTAYYLVIRSSSSGVITEERIPQTDWNGDKLDGTGASGITLYPDRVQILYTDIEWLGVGTVRCGFVIDGRFILAHSFHHANQTGNTTTYMTTACLPIRYEISSTGPGGTLRQICSSVISEGGYSLTGVQSAIGHDFSNPVRLPNNGSFKPVIAIRLKSTNADAIVLPNSYTIIPTGSSLVHYKIYTRVTTTGGTWVDMGSQSSVEYNLAPATRTGGKVNEAGYILSTNQSTTGPQLQETLFERQLARDSGANIMYEYVIEAATTGTNIDIYATVSWQEIT